MRNPTRLKVKSKPLNDKEFVRSFPKFRSKITGIYNGGGVEIKNLLVSYNL